MKIIVYDIGSLADSLTAIGTMAAVFVAVYFSRRNMKPIAKVTANIKYVRELDGEVNPSFVEVLIVNKGMVPIKVSGCNLYFKDILYGTSEEPVLLKTGEPHVSIFRYEAIEAFLREINRKTLKTYFYFQDASGIKYKSKNSNLKFKERLFRCFFHAQNKQRG